jgi:peroxiredoxin
VFCQQQVAQLRDVSEEIRRRGADLVVVGNGGVEQARAFRDARGLPFALYTDPSLESYQRAELQHGVTSSLSPRVVLHALNAFGQGYRQTSIQGDPLQQGGVFVIARGGRVLFEYASRRAGDHPDNRNVLRVLDDAHAEAGA